jgi:hypothetical protein
MSADPETGGVGCRIYVHTLALLTALRLHLQGQKVEQLTADLLDAAEAIQNLLSTESEWARG